MINRRKSRYVLIEASHAVNMDRSNTQSLMRELTKFIGELSYSNANPQMVNQQDERTFILRVNRGQERTLILGLCFIKRLDSGTIGFYSILTSGTIRSLKDYYQTNY